MKMNAITGTWTCSMSGCLFLSMKDNVTNSNIAQIHAECLSKGDLSTFAFPLLRWESMLAWNSYLFFWKGNMIKSLKNPLPDVWSMNKPVHDTEEQSTEEIAKRPGPSADSRQNKEQTRDQNQPSHILRENMQIHRNGVLVPNESSGHGGHSVPPQVIDRGGSEGLSLQRRRKFLLVGRKHDGEEPATLSQAFCVYNFFVLYLLLLIL